MAFIAALQNFGFNVTGLIAGLGVGGLAVALAAQKTVENLFGSISLVADQPVRLGDVCRFGDTVGTRRGHRPPLRRASAPLDADARDDPERAVLHHGDREPEPVRDRIPVRATLALPQGDHCGPVREILANLRSEVGRPGASTARSARASLVRLESQALDDRALRLRHGDRAGTSTFVGPRAGASSASALEVLGDQGRVVGQWRLRYPPLRAPTPGGAGEPRQRCSVDGEPAFRRIIQAVARARRASG